MQSGEDYIDNVLKDLAENSYGTADTEYFTRASHLLHDSFNKLKSEPRALTKDEAWVMDEIKSFHEMWEHHDYEYDELLRSLVIKISNILNPTVPTVYNNDSDLPEPSHEPRLVGVTMPDGQVVRLHKAERNNLKSEEK